MGPPSSVLLVCVILRSEYQDLHLLLVFEMAYSAFAHTSTFSLFPNSPASPNAFAIFTHAQSPRENHAMYEDLRLVFGNNNGRTCPNKQRSAGSRMGLKKILGGM
ncbi:hypothetical protein J3A83DRAFT_4370293 [Scleroderma citrinum]